MKFIRMCVAALLLCLAFACNNYSSENEMAVADTTATAAYKNEGIVQFQKPEEPGAPGENKQDQKPPQTNATSANYADWEKKIIKNAQLNIEVEDYLAFNQQVHNNLKQWGAYIAQEEQQATEYRKENNIYIKVPVDQFDNMVQSLTSGKEKVIVKKITSEDVTGEVVDTKSRMEAKRRIRQRYMDLLDKAKNMEEILQVQNEIDDIQVEIESAEGRVNYLTHASAMSTVQLTFFQVLKPGAPNENQPSFGFRVLDSLKNGLVWIGEFLIVLLSLWPLALIGVIAYWGFKKWRATKLKTGN